jgi:hypothetical protein
LPVARPNRMARRPFESEKLARPDKTRLSKTKRAETDNY